MSTPALDVESLWVKARPDANGLLPCVVQDIRSRRVLMVAWVSRSALERALETGQATFWSRSRRELWEKGATSGNRQKLMHVRLDCDGDTLMYLVEATGPACHEGYTSCFSWRRVGNGWRRDADDTDHGDHPSEAVHPQLVEDLISVGSEIADDDPEPEAKATPRALRPEKAIRIGAAIESRARGLATALQLKQKEKARDAAALLVSEVVRALATAGMTPDDLRNALTPTEKARPASSRTRAPTPSDLPPKDEPSSG